MKTTRLARITATRWNNIQDNSGLQRIKQSQYMPENDVQQLKQTTIKNLLTIRSLTYQHEINYHLRKKLSQENSKLS
jgi:hypothetical protein